MRRRRGEERRVELGMEGMKGMEGSADWGACSNVFGSGVEGDLNWTWIWT